VEIKHVSSFKLQGDRNPFWPIGWRPSTAGSSSTQATGELPATAFVVSSIAIEKNGRFAIVNGKIMQQGQTFGLKMGATTYELTVKAIEDGRVIIGYYDQEIVVPLTRK
jgi:hypothetical protein